MYQLLLLPAADRELSRLVRNMSAREAGALRQALDGLQDDPRAPAVVRLRGMDAYRLRSGDYRVIYEIDDAMRTVTVLRIARRSERTYKF